MAEAAPLRERPRKLLPLWWMRLTDITKRLDIVKSQLHALRAGLPQSGLPPPSSYDSGLVVLPNPADQKTETISLDQIESANVIPNRRH
jgi:hypothetical protein